MTPTAHSGAFRREVRAFIDALVQNLGAAQDWPAGVDRRVPEVARFEWLDALVPRLHPFWAAHVGAVGAEAPVGGAFVRREHTLRGGLTGARRAAVAAVSPVAPRPRPGARIVFVEHYPAGTAVAALVAAALEETDGASSTVLTTTDPATRAAAHVSGVFLARVARRRARLAALRAEGRVRRNATKLAELAVADVPSSWRSIVPSLEPLLADSIAASWPRAASHLVLLDDAFDRTGPSAVATSSYTGSHARSAVLLARARGIRSMYLQHGPLFHFNDGTGLLHDGYLVWGDRDRRALLERGVAADAVVVTGCPTMDGVGARCAESGPRDGNRPFRVLYLPSRTAGGLVSHDAARAMLDAVLAAARPLARTELVVKTHPRDRSEIFDDLDDAVTVQRQGDALDAILAADVVVAATSTAGLEACALDRPLLVLTFPGVDLLIDYEGYGAALPAEDAAAVTEGLRRLRDDPELLDRLAAGRQALVDDMFGGLLPGAASRAADVLAASASDAEPGLRDRDMALHR